MDSLISRCRYVTETPKAKALVLISLFMVSGISAVFWSNVINPVYAPTTAATLTEWTIPTPSSTPTGLTLDPSGNCCWFVELSGNKVAQLDPSTNTFREWAIPTPGSSITGLAATTISGSIALFGVEFATNKVFIFFPNTNTFKEYTLPTVDSGPEYISIEPAGTDIRAWFPEFGGPSNSYTRNSIGELIYTPSNGNAFLYELTLPAGAGGGANGVYAGSGIIWFAGVNGLVKWDRAASQFTTWAIPSHPSTTGAFVDVDALGQPWYTSRSSGASPNNYVGVLRGDNTYKEWQVPTIGADPREISINPSTQSPWIAEQGGSKVAALDPSSGGTVTASPPAITPFAPVLGALVTATPPPVGPSTAIVSPTSGPNTGSTTSQFTEWTLPASTPHDVKVDSSGNVWILESGTNKVAKLTLSTPDFGLSASPGTVTIAQGASGSVAVTGNSILSFSGPVTLSVTGSVPAGVTFSTFTPNPIIIPSGGSVSATLGINVASSATPSTSIITLSGVGAATHTTSFVLVIASGNDFSLSLSSSALSVGSGSSATDTVTVTSLAAFNSAVSLTASGLPSGVHVSFSPSSVTPPPAGTVTSMATVSVDSGTPASTPTITITGTSGSLTHFQTIALTITITPDFTITAGPSSISIAQGASGTSTITVGSLNGFTSAVALSNSWMGSAPSGVTVNIPGPITPPSGSTATSTLTVSASPGSSLGSFTLSIIGTSGALTHNVNVGIVITAAGTTSSSSTTTLGAPKCLIATATYGSELAPEVQLLRNFRDNSILKTSAGSNFMLAFNAWYYSFSPYVANYLNTHWVERTIMKGVLYPLIGMLYLTSNLFVVTATYPEVAALVSGLLASSLIGAFYLGLPFAVLRTRIRRLRGWRTQRSLQKILAAALLIAFGIMLVGEFISSTPLLIISSSTIVLATLFLSAIITSGTIAKRFTTK